MPLALPVLKQKSQIKRKIRVEKQDVKRGTGEGLWNPVLF